MVLFGQVELKISQKYVQHLGTNFAHWFLHVRLCMSDVIFKKIQR